MVDYNISRNPRWLDYSLIFGNLQQLKLINRIKMVTLIGMYVCIVVQHECNCCFCVRSWSFLVEGDEDLFWPKCIKYQNNRDCPCRMINIFALQLGRYKPLISFYKRVEWFIRFIFIRLAKLPLDTGLVIIKTGPFSYSRILILGLLCIMSSQV